MTDVKIFNSPMFGELRVTRNEKGELLFCLTDVCKALDLQTGATVAQQALSSKHHLQAVGTMEFAQTL